MDNKILLFDLDGTLLRNDKTISARTIKVLSLCKKKGFIVGISTSRSEKNCRSFIGTVQPDFLISSGGALVKKDGRTVFASAFSADEVRAFIETVWRVCGHACEITVDTADAHYWNYQVNPKNQDPSWGDSVYTDYSDFSQEAYKICVEIHEPALLEALCVKFPGYDCVRFSDGDWYKFTKYGITKEKAILKLCDASRWTPEEITAFGDDFADLGMLKLCGKGIAMGNAIKTVKEIADEVILSNEEDGIAVYLERLLRF